MSNNNGHFKKAMRPIDVWGLALGAIIGWGCFVLPGNAFLPKAGPLGTAAGMLIGALLIVVISLSYGYLIRCVSKYPDIVIKPFNIIAKFNSLFGHTLRRFCHRL